MTTTTAWPRTQHWNVDGFRVTVIVYKSHARDCCRTCGERGAIHSVWTDKRGDGFSGPPAEFCGRHRPEKATRPDLAYERISHSNPRTSSWVLTRERLTPEPAWLCDACDAASIVCNEYRCDDCREPAHNPIRTERIITFDGERAETKIRHEMHVLRKEQHCAVHRSALPAEAAG